MIGPRSGGATLSPATRSCLKLKLSPSPPPGAFVPRPIPNPMSFEDNLQLALDPAASEAEQLPRELHLGQYAWKNGEIDWKDETPGFRQLRADELRQLMRRLQAAPQHHVILLNLMGHDIGEDMMRELAEPIAALKALQVLILCRNLFLIYFGLCFAA